MLYKTITLVVLVSLILSGCGGPVSFNCTVKVVSNNASVTVDGVLAGDTCQKILNNPKDVFGSTLAEGLQDKTKWFSPSEASKEPEVCIYEISGKKFTVRDQGVFKFLGSSLCQTLSDLSKANSAPRVTVLPANPTPKSP